MIQLKRLPSRLSCCLIASVLSVVANTAEAQATALVNYLTIPGETTDLSLLNDGNGGANINRLGGFGSDLFYDRYNNVYYGVADRGPGGGTISYDTRVQKFSLDVNPNSGTISNFNLLDTILFKQPDGTNFNGLSPELDPKNGNPRVLGRSLDPEGFLVAPNGNFYVSDEYGPSIDEFLSDGTFVRSLQTPDNLLPRDSNGNLNFATGANADPVVSGRVANRGFEGLSISPDGTKIFAILQDPLTSEGNPNERSSRNIRLVEFDTVTGKSVGQYIYQLDSIADINSRVPSAPFTANQQGRNIGVSALTALNDHEFLVIERDNRGVGVGDTSGKNPPVASKRVYEIDLTGATDVSNISLKSTNNLPSSVKPVSKSSSPFIDLAGALQAIGQIPAEKIEGIAIGPQLNDGSYAVILGTDNDFSVTQDSSNVQFDVCTGGAQVPIDSSCPIGQTLLPSYLYSFKASAAELAGYVPPQKQPASVPEPSATAGILLAGLGAYWLKGRQRLRNHK